MRGWAKDQGTEGSILTLYGDPSGEFTKACGMELTHEGPTKKGLYGRCKRWAMIIENNIVKGVAVAESESDPAGDDHPEATLSEALLKMVKEAEA